MYKLRSLLLVATILVSIILLSHTSLFAQVLHRRAFLGAQLSLLAENQNSNSNNEGLHIDSVISSGTLSSMNVTNGTILQTINENRIKSLSDLSIAMSNIKEGDDISVSILENGIVKRYDGIAKGRPTETNKHAEVIYGQVTYNNNSLRSILYMPFGIEKPPVVFFLQGYPCQSIEMPDNIPAKQLINAWLQEGFAVYLVEKPGLGDSECKKHCQNIDFNEELRAFTEAYKDLLSNELLDQQQVFMFGYSMGGIIAPLLAQHKSPTGIMVYGIVGMNWYNYMIKIFTEQPKIFGTSQQEIEAENFYYLPFIKDLLKHKKNNIELLQSKLYGEKLKEDRIAEQLFNGQYIMRNYKYWQTLADIDIPKTWSKIQTPVYVLHGEYDIQAINPEYGKMIVTNVRQNGGHAQFDLLSKTEHSFLKYDSMDELLDSMNNGNHANSFLTHFNTEIVDKSVSWMRSISKR